VLRLYSIRHGIATIQGWRDDPKAAELQRRLRGRKRSAAASSAARITARAFRRKIADSTNGAICFSRPPPSTTRPSLPPSQAYITPACFGAAGPSVTMSIPGGRSTAESCHLFARICRGPRSATAMRDSDAGSVSRAELKQELSDAQVEWQRTHHRSIRRAS
jgi:hypothetical protein